MPPFKTYHSSLTTIYDEPRLFFPVIPNITTPTNPVPDVASPYVAIPLTLTSYTPPDERPGASQVSSGPIINQFTGFAEGGYAVTESANTFARITLEGTIDTPLTVSGKNAFPSVVVEGTINLTFGDLIGIYFEGRIKDTWGKLEPLSFRDPYGRVYDDPKIIEYSASYVEAVPGRTSFSMTLLV